MKYCRRCILPDTRPGLVLDGGGICNACRRHGTKTDGSINWSDRAEAFRRVVADARGRSPDGYECVVPVSGGKDSTWQVIKCLESGLTPLAVTWKTPGRTAVGARNLANLVNLGVDHIDYQISPAVERRFMYRALVTHGSTAVPMHMALFAIPLRIAVRFRIPLVVWGENSAFEYGGEEAHSRSFDLNNAWLRKFGCTFGTTAEDWVGDGLTRENLTAYFWPSDEELARGGVRAVFLGAYFPWDPRMTYRAAKARGFRANPAGPRTGYYDYADIDDAFISIHHWLKWYKFGFTRLFDNLSIEIRNRRLTREEAIEIVRDAGDQTPHDDISRLCRFVGLTDDGFFALAEKFRNRDIWMECDGSWKIRDFLIPQWSWTGGAAACH